MLLLQQIIPCLIGWYGAPEHETLTLLTTSIPQGDPLVHIADSIDAHGQPQAVPQSNQDVYDFAALLFGFPTIQQSFGQS
jgi:hypothetical protein